MKSSFIIKLPSAKQDNKGTYKSHLVGKLFRRYPWLTDDDTCGVDPDLLGKKTISWAGPDDGFQFGKKHSLYDVDFSPKDYIADLNRQLAHEREVDVYDLYNDYHAAMDRLDNYANARRRRFESADFRLPDGTGVNVHDGFIQVGTEIIPRNAAFNYFVRMPKVHRVVVLKAIISVKEYLAA